MLEYITCLLHPLSFATARRKGQLRAERHICSLNLFRTRTSFHHTYVRRQCAYWLAPYNKGAPRFIISSLLSFPPTSSKRIAKLNGPPRVSTHTLNGNTISAQIHTLKVPPFYDCHERNVHTSTTRPSPTLTNFRRYSICMPSLAQTLEARRN